MAIAKFMAGPIGRGVRILVGVALIALGLSGSLDQTTGIIVAVVGVLPVLAGALNFCLIAPLLGAPLSGAKISKG